MVIVLMMVLSACSSERQRNDEKQQEPAKHVWAISLSSGSQKPERHLTGQLQAADTVPISFEVSGVVKSMQVNLGESFKQGDVLAQLDQSVYMLNVEQQRSALGESAAALAESQLNYQRNQTLRKQGLVSQAQVDNLKTSYDIAVKRVNVAQSRLDLALKNLSDTELVAPYDGRVSSRLVEPSQHVTPSVPVFEIQGNAKLELSAAIPESLIGKVSLLDLVTVKVPSISGDRTYAAVLTEIGAQASLANAFPVTVTLKEFHPDFHPGMSAELVIQIASQTSNETTFIIPVNAYATDNQGNYVYVINQQNTLDRVSINILETYRKEVLIRATSDTLTMTKGANIVRTGLSFLRPNQPVTIVDSSVSIYNE